MKLGEVLVMQKKRRRQHIIKTKSEAMTKRRFKPWNDKDDKYTLFKRARTIGRKQLIERPEDLSHDDLFYFVHKDERVQRGDDLEPKWVAVFHVDTGRYVFPQQPLLARIYADCGRNDPEKATTMCADGTPYWVDRYWARYKRDRLAKKRYQAKKFAKNV